MDLILKAAKPTLRSVQSLVLRVTKGVTFGIRGFVTDGDAILMVRHSYVPGWHIPGGSVDPHESAEDAVRRELDEEAGIAPVGPLRLLGVHFNRAMAGRDHVAVYHVAAHRRLRPFVPSREILEARFFSMDALPDDTGGGTLRRIEEFRTGAPPAALW